MQKKQIGIGLLGKGSTNHLHRSEVVRAFQQKGFQVTYIVREDYYNLLTRLTGCRYTSCRIREENGWRSIPIRFCQNVRFAYPSSDAGHRRFLLKRIMNNLRPWVLIRDFICLAAARFRVFVMFATWLEKKLFLPDLVEGLDPCDYDILIFLGIGTVDSELEGALTYWAENYDIPKIHIVGNYDHLTSKGFRGIMPKRLLVWGPQMREDAISFHGIPAKRISIIGSIRYNSLNRADLPERSVFLSRLGLDPARKTILFAGFVFVSQYFEMLKVYRRLLENNIDCQLILRLYPNKTLMNSVYIEALTCFAKALPHTYISYADPHFKKGDRNKEVLQVEEDELRAVLCHCDVLIDYYSTITLEGGIFDKPCLHMHYIPKTPGAFARAAVSVNFWELRHNQRIMSYGGVEVANSRDELIDLIQKNLFDPGRHAKARKRMVQQECGPMDGLACERLIKNCESLLVTHSCSQISQ